MGSFINFLNNYSGIFLIISVIFLIIISYKFVQLNKKISLQKKRYDLLLRGRGDLNLGELLAEHSKDINKINKDMESLKADINVAISKSAFSIQKVGFVKYDAFFDLKNKLSFSIALLDSFNNGMLFTTIYGRESCITYAKEVKAGQVSQELSSEETEALQKAIGK